LLNEPFLRKVIELDLCFMLSGGCNEAKLNSLDSLDTILCRLLTSNFIEICQAVLEMNHAD